MTLKVITSEPARADVRADCRWWAEHRSAEQAERWFDACEAAITSLSHRAEHCLLAPEDDAFPFELRQLTFGLGRKPTHRILFTIRPEMIFVLRVQHLAQQFLTLDDL